MTNPEIEKTMAEVREDVAGLFIAYHQGEFTSHEAPDKVFKLPISIGGGVCPRKDCSLYPEFCPNSYKKCLVLSKKERALELVKTITVEQAIREKLEK